MVILAPNLVMNRNMSMCVYVSVHVCVYMCVSESLCSPAHVSGCRKGVMQSVVRKESPQTITVPGQQAGDSSVIDGVSALWCCWLADPGHCFILHSFSQSGKWSFQSLEITSCPYYKC